MRSYAHFFDIGGEEHMQFIAKLSEALYLDHGVAVSTSVCTFVANVSGMQLVKLEECH